VFERIREAYPNMLFIEKEAGGGSSYSVREFEGGRQPDVYELCMAFLNDPGTEECELLRDVINTVKEGRR